MMHQPTTPRMLDDGTETPADDDDQPVSRFSTLYSLRSDDDGRYAVVAFDRYGRRVHAHALEGVLFVSPREAFDAIRRAESGSGEHALDLAKTEATLNAEAAARSA